MVRGVRTRPLGRDGGARQAFRVFEDNMPAASQTVFHCKAGERGIAAVRATEEPVKRQAAPLSRALESLQNLVGLGGVKRNVEELAAYTAVSRWREAAGLRVESTVQHMVFTGRPGTGKTTVARIIGDIYRDLGVLSTGQVIEMERADLVGEYVGQTAVRTRAAIERAIGGVLFIDEAYALARGGERDFGREAIDTLVKGMEDHRRDLVVILAGYELEMDWFLAQNPGLRSRFPLHVVFPDYDDRELIDIARRMAAERDYRLSVDALGMLQKALRQERERGAFANARTVRNLLEAAMRRQALRLFPGERPTVENLLELTGRDFEEGRVSASLSELVAGKRPQGADPPPAGPAS